MDPDFKKLPSKDDLDQRIIPFVAPPAQPERREVRGKTRTEKIQDLLDTRTCWQWTDDARTAFAVVYKEPAEWTAIRGVGGNCWYFLADVASTPSTNELLQRAARDGCVLRFTYNIYFLSVDYYLVYLQYEGTSAEDQRQYAFYHGMLDELIAYPPSDKPTEIIIPELDLYDGVIERRKAEALLTIAKLSKGIS